MGYYTGTAATIDAVRDAVKDACVLEGWTWDATEQIIYKGTMFFKLTAGVSGRNYLRVEGRTALTGGDLPPNYCAIQEFDQVLFTFPITYHVFIFTNEVWVSVKIAPAQYMHATFGQSQLPGFNGTGNFFAASAGQVGSVNLNIGGSQIPVVMFYQTNNWGNSNLRNYFCHTQINTDAPWQAVNTTTDTTRLGWQYITTLLNNQPNSYSQESILLPKSIYHKYASSKYGQVLEMANARFIRIDNLVDEQILEFGADKWMVFPCYRKDINNRNTINASVSGLISGTYGVAVKYEGP